MPNNSRPSSGRQPRNEKTQRFVRGFKCPVCGGCDDDPRGQGQRCHGYIGADGKLIFCAREEHAGRAEFDDGSGCYRHTARGPCPCGVEHKPAELVPSKKRAGKPKPWERPIDHIYKYHGLDGKVLFEVIRFKDVKDFCQRRPVGNGKYKWSLAGITPILYKLPGLMTADPSEVVWIPEGEKDVDNLGAKGLIATCNPMGAEKWRDHYSESLRDRHVVILPDNDQAGQKHAQRVAQSLHGVAASIRIVELPGLPEKGDVSDFLTAGGTVDQLRELADQAEEWHPIKPTPHIVIPMKPETNGYTNGHANGHSPTYAPGTLLKCLDRGNFGYVVEDLGDRVHMEFKPDDPEHRGEATLPKSEVELPDGSASIDSASDPEPDYPLVVRADTVQPKQVKWLWKWRVPFGFISIFAGRTGIGKSFVALYLAARYSRGEPLEGDDGERLDPGRVLIISEDPHDFVLRPRLDALDADLTRIHFMTWEAMGAYKLGDTKLLDRVVQAAENPGLIIIDPPTNFLGGIDEHSNSAVRGILMNMVTWLVKQPSPPAMVLITQVNKGAGGKEVEAVNRIIGSVAWAATSRIAHTFAPEKDTPGQALFCCPKSNIGPRPKSLSYRIVSEGDSVRLEWIGESEKSADEAMNGGKKEASRCVAAEAFLIEAFNRRMDWPSEELFEEASKKGIGKNAMFEAKKSLNLPKAKKAGDAWHWAVDYDWEYLRRDSEATPTPY